MREYIEPVDDVQHGKDQHGLFRHGHAEAVLQKPDTDHHLQQQHRDARIHERVADALDADVLPPVGQGAALGPAGGHDHLDHVAHAGDAEPDEGAEPGQEPPVLRIDEGDEGRDEAQQHLEAVAQAAVEIPAVGPCLFPLRRIGQAVALEGAQAAEVDHVALVADTAVLTGSPPDAAPLHAQMAAARQKTEMGQQGLPGRGVLRLVVADLLFHR